MAPHRPAKSSKRKGSGLRSCPFCREMFTDDDDFEICPECGVQLKDITDLPLSPEAEMLLAEEAAGARPLGAPAPAADRLPWYDMGRGRGILTVCALAGMISFFTPWAIETMPHLVKYSGADMAHAKNFFWSIFVAWLVLVPSVLSRRTPLKMVGARVACAFLAAIPAAQCFILMNRPSRIVLKGIAHEYHWGPGFYATIVLSVVSTIVAIRFGGPVQKVAK